MNENVEEVVIVKQSYSSDSSQTEVPEVKKKKKVSRKPKYFQESWFEEFPAWRNWVLRLDDATKFYCKICSRVLASGKSQIQAHEASMSHRNKVNIFERSDLLGVDITKVQTIQTIHTNFNHVAHFNYYSQEVPEEIAASLEVSTDNPPRTFKDKVKECEIKITAFIYTHNVPFSIVSELLDLFKDMEPAVLKAVKLSRAKMTNIADKVITPIETDRLVSTLRESPFSVYIDESTDVSNEKCIPLLVRYVEPKELVVRVELLQQIVLDSNDISSEKIFEVFENILREKEIPLENVEGLSCENTSVVGKNTSFKSKLQKKGSRLRIFPCSNNSFNLSTKSIFKAIPDSNAEAKRIFSILKDIKTSKRNRLCDRSINSICVIRSALAARHMTAKEMEITEKHLELMSSEIYRSNASEKKEPSWQKT